jgi:hypothetical protein
MAMPHQTFGVERCVAAETWLLAAACRCEHSTGDVRDILPASLRREVTMTLLVGVASAIFFGHLFVALAGAREPGPAPLQSTAVAAIAPLVETARPAASWAPARPQERLARPAARNGVRPPRVEVVAAAAGEVLRVIEHPVMPTSGEILGSAVAEPEAVDRALPGSSAGRRAGVAPILAAVGRAIAGSGRYRVQPFPTPDG